MYLFYKLLFEIKYVELLTVIQINGNNKKKERWWSFDTEVIASNVFDGRDDSSVDANGDIDDCHGNSDADYYIDDDNDDDSDDCDV